MLAELHGLIAKTSGLVAPLRAALAPLADRIRAAFDYGAIAKGTDTAASDIDLMVIADSLHYAIGVEVAGARLGAGATQSGRIPGRSTMTGGCWRN